MVNTSRNSNNSEIMSSNPAFMNISDGSDIISMKFRLFQLNKMKNLEKKREYCDCPLVEYSSNDSGKQITAFLNTVTYEALKNNAILLFSGFGSVALINPSVVSNDLENANVETQHYLRLNNDGYNVTLTFYHTSCNMTVQSYRNDELFRVDGKYPVEAFVKKYVDSAVQVIVEKVDIKTETDRIRLKLT
jgi:hypothetical protein